MSGTGTQLYDNIQAGESCKEDVTFSKLKKRANGFRRMVETFQRSYKGLYKYPTFSLNCRVKLSKKKLFFFNFITQKHLLHHEK